MNLAHWGSCLKEAREARGYPVQWLADRVGLTREAIYQFERGDRKPTLASIESLADALEVPIKFFEGPPAPESLNPVFYRSLTSVRKRAEVRMAERKLGWLRQLVESLDQLVEFPVVDLPAFSMPSDPLDLDESKIEDIAVELRAKWELGDGAISNVAWLLENHGCIVCRNRLGVSAIDAFSQYADRSQRPVIVLAGNDATHVRSQADCAHELGHLIIHRNIDKRWLKDHARYKIIEKQAWRFARAFLLPRETFIRSITSFELEAFMFLKEAWLVSGAMMLKRAEDLNLLDESRARELWIRRNARSWNKNEPFDSKIVIEPPRLLPQAVDAIVEAGAHFVRKWISSIRLSIEEAAAFTGYSATALRDAFERIPPRPNIREIASG